jgi:hypothetical protein
MFGLEKLGHEFWNFEPMASTQWSGFVFPGPSEGDFFPVISDTRISIIVHNFDYSRAQECQPKVVLLHRTIAVTDNSPRVGAIAGFLCNRKGAENHDRDAPYLMQVTYTLYVHGRFHVTL